MYGTFCECLLNVFWKNSAQPFILYSSLETYAYEVVFYSIILIKHLKHIFTTSLSYE